VVELIIRWICKECNKKWIYPIEKCVYCKDGGKIEKIIGKKTKVVGITKVSIPSPVHPIVPYYTLILEDENGNRMPKKVMKEYKLGDEFSWEKSDDENAVSIVKIKYDYDEAVKQAFELIGDVEVNEGTKVLIKPDMMVEAYPYLAMTTNPKVVKALIDYLVEKGVKKENITLAEQTQYGDFEKAVSKGGFGKIVKEFGVKFVDVSKSEFVEKESGGFRFSIAKEVFDNDLVINVPILKTHLLLGIAGALENMTRFISAENYKELSKDPKKAVEGIVQLHKVLPKYVTLGDASIGMQGNGPMKYGEPAFMNMVLASKDPVAIDKVFQEIGLLKDVEYVEAAGKMGVGCSDLREIVIVGDELDACRRELKPAIGSKLIKMS
tara:strand:- start:549 stop:1688 length:1140 start_codon:yes stop_codon:yes gene_type:complete